MVYETMVREALAELADARYQSLVWLGLIDDVTASPERVLNDPRLPRCRELAAEILRLLPPAEGVI